MKTSSLSKSMLALNEREYSKYVEARLVSETELLEVTFGGPVKVGDRVKMRNKWGWFSLWTVNCVLESDPSRGSLVSEDAEDTLSEQGWEARDAAQIWLDTAPGDD